MALSDMQCRTSKPKEKPYKLFDGEGLYLEVTQSGGKLWRLKYRLHGKEKRISFGAYPAISLAAARQQKAFAKEQVRNGLDPILKRIEQRQTDVFANANTFKEIALEWYAKQLADWEPRYAKTVLHRLEKYLFKDLGTYPVANLKPLIVLTCIQKIENNAPEMARRVLQYCHHICLYAVITERIETDPTIGLVHALRKFKRGHFASIDVDELAKLLYDLHEFKLRLNRQTFLAIKLMLLTFIRTRELIKGKWDEVNFDTSIWTIPAERMKMKRPHLVPLCRQAISILYELKKINANSEYIFPGISKINRTMSNGTILVALTRMGYKNKMTGHGFRALAMGILKEKLGYSHELVDRQLAHAPKSNNNRAYDRALFLPQRIEMMQKYGDYMDEIYLQAIRTKS